ncbi:MAG: N5-glutamine methyltransferase family protein, partial [Thermodesulfobacteriota bacterium]
MIREDKSDMTLREALLTTEAQLCEAGIEEAPVEAQWILAEVLSMKRFELFLSRTKELTVKESHRLDKIIKRRQRREPLAYIIGSTDFRGHTIRVSRDTLIPRPETELLVDEALALLRNGTGTQRVLEPCTGSGCVSVALASEFEGVEIIAIDISAGALTLARENAICNNVGKKIDFIRGDLLSPVKEGTDFDLIAANPPYIPDLEME